MANIVERMTVQAAGAIGALRASVRGLSGIFARLSEEHRQTVAMLEQTISADEEAERTRLWHEAMHELLAHERAEREHVYSSLAKVDALAHFAVQHEAETQALQELVIDVDTALCSTQWHIMLERLAEVVRRHAEREEAFFILAQDEVGTERAAELEGLYTTERLRILHELKSQTDNDPADVK